MRQFCTLYQMDCFIFSLKSLVPIFYLLKLLFLQALGMLLWHKHDVEKSLADLANFTPFPEEWTVEDKVLFEQAFSFHGKSFHRIQQMVSTSTSVPVESVNPNAPSKP